MTCDRCGDAVNESLAVKTTRPFLDQNGIIVNNHIVPLSRQYTFCSPDCFALYFATAIEYYRINRPLTHQEIESQYDKWQETERE